MTTIHDINSWQFMIVLRTGNPQLMRGFSSSLNELEYEVHLRQLFETQTHVFRLIQQSFNFTVNAVIPILIILVFVSEGYIVQMERIPFNIFPNKVLN